MVGVRKDAEGSSAAGLKLALLPDKPISDNVIGPIIDIKLQHYTTEGYSPRLELRTTYEPWAISEPSMLIVRSRFFASEVMQGLLRGSL